MKKNLVLMSVVFATSTAILQLPALAEIPNVGGRVFLHATGHAVTVPVRLKNVNNQATSDVVYTDQDGWYNFYGVPPGSYVLEVLAAKADGNWLSILTSPPFRVIQNRFVRVADVRVP